MPVVNLHGQTGLIHAAPDALVQNPLVVFGDTRISAPSSSKKVLANTWYLAYNKPCGIPIFIGFSRPPFRDPARLPPILPIIARILSIYNLF
jgi:hypothetical protein